MLFLCKPTERMFKTGNSSKRRDRYGQIDLEVGTGALEQGLLVIAVAPAGPLTRVYEIEATD